MRIAGSASALNAGDNAAHVREVLILGNALWLALAQAIRLTPYFARLGA